MWIRALACVALMTITGWIHGLWTDRWVSVNDLPQSSDLARFPLHVGNWEGRDVSAEESEIVARTDAPQIVRRYMNRKDGTVICFLLTAGQPVGMILDHRPIACYSAIGYREVGKGKKIVVRDDPRAEYFAHTFLKNTPTNSSRVRLFWAWSDGSGWLFPDEPRLRFAGRSVLYKMYVTRELLEENESAETDPAISFLNEIVPEFDSTVDSVLRKR